MSGKANSTLYQRLLGQDFALLPPVLQQFHGQVNGGEASGNLMVERGRGALRPLAATLLRLPPQGAVPLTLKVSVEGERERWIRHFGSHRLETLQWQEGEYLVEKTGAMEFVFRVTASRKGMVFSLVHNRIGGMRVPTLLSMPIHAAVNGYEGNWQVCVNINSILLGRLMTYAGEVTPK